MSAVDDALWPTFPYRTTTSDDELATLIEHAYREIEMMALSHLIAITVEPIRRSRSRTCVFRDPSVATLK